MIRSISLLIFFTALHLLTAQAQKTESNGYKLTGTLNEGTAGFAYLTYTYDDVSFRDSTVIVNGHFKFEGQVPETIFVNLRIAETQKWVGFFLDNQAISIGFNPDNVLVEKGGLNQEVWAIWQHRWGEIHQRAGKIYAKLNAAYVKEGKDPSGRNAKLSEEAQKAIDAEFAVLGADTDSIVYAMVRKYPNSVVTPFIIIDRYVNWNALDKAKVLYPLLTDGVKASFYGRQVAEAIKKDNLTIIGVAAPDFTMNDTNGQPLVLSSLKGKYVLVDFWASWCGPCRKENPNVVRMYKTYHEKGLEILGVSLDSKKEAWLKAIAEDELAWHHVSDLQGWKNAAALQYGVKSVPATFLLDKEGKVIARNLRGEELEQKLSELMP